MDIVSITSDFIIQHANHAHWIIFVALILAGFNLPISEDLMLITSGWLASSVVPNNIWKLFIASFLGCYFSDWISYCIGKYFGTKLWNIKWFEKRVGKRKLKLIQNYYKKYGFWTIILGRFIPFGVRNCLFLTAGIGRMHFLKFIITDGIACIISNTALFYAAYSFGKNKALLWEYISQYNILILSIFVSICFAVFLLIRNKKVVVYPSE